MLDRGTLEEANILGLRAKFDAMLLAEKKQRIQLYTFTDAVNSQ